MSNASNFCSQTESQANIEPSNMPANATVANPKSLLQFSAIKKFIWITALIQHTLYIHKVHVRMCVCYAYCYVYMLVADIIPCTHSKSHLYLSLSVERARTNQRAHIHKRMVFGLKCQSIRLVCRSMRGCVCVCFSVCVSKWRPSFYFLLVP